MDMLSEDSSQRFRIVRREKRQGSVNFGGSRRHPGPARSTIRREADILLAKNLLEQCFRMLAETEPVWEYIEFPDLLYPGLDRSFEPDEYPLIAEFSDIWSTIQIINVELTLYDQIRPEMFTELLKTFSLLQTIVERIESLIQCRISMLREMYTLWTWNECFLESRIAHLIDIIEYKDIDSFHVKSARESLQALYEDSGNIEYWIKDTDTIIRLSLQDRSVYRHYQRRTNTIRVSVCRELKAAEKMFEKSSRKHQTVSVILHMARQAFTDADKQYRVNSVINESSAFEFMKIRELLIQAYLVW